MEINNEQNSGRKMSEAEKQSVIEKLWLISTILFTEKV